MLTGTLSVSHGFDVGFAAAAILMILGLIHYHWHRRRLSASWRDDVRGDVEKPTSPITRRGLVIVASAVAGIAATMTWLTASGILHLQRLPTVMLAATMAATVTLFAQILLDPDIERAERRRVLAFIPLFIAVAATVLPWIRRLIAGDPASMAAPPTAGDDAPARVDSPRTPTPGSCR